MKQVSISVQVSLNSKHDIVHVVFKGNGRTVRCYYFAWHEGLQENHVWHVMLSNGRRKVCRDCLWNCITEFYRFIEAGHNPAASFVHPLWPWECADPTELPEYSIPF